MISTIKNNFIVAGVFPTILWLAALIGWFVMSEVVNDTQTFVKQPTEQCTVKITDTADDLNLVASCFVGTEFERHFHNWSHRAIVDFMNGKYTKVECDWSVGEMDKELIYSCKMK